MRQFECFRLDTSNECLWREGEQIALSPRPFAVLRYLVENPARLITYDEMLDALWPETYVQPQVLRTYVLELRKILGDDAAQPRFIQTHSKRGYVFIAPVNEAAEVCAESAPEAGSGASVAGREREVASLLALAKAAAKGERRVVFVTGEAGIGKSDLVEALCREVAATMLVARGQCVEGLQGREENYPVMEALSQLCASSAGEEACKALEKLAPAWLAAVGRGGDGGGRGQRAPAPGDLCAALEEIARGRPLLLVLEDLNWADDSTLHLVSALARRRAAAALLLVATCGLRNEKSGHPLRALKNDLLLRKLATEMTLGPLPKAAIAQLVHRELELDAETNGLPPGLLAFVHQRSEGNPLFARAIVEHLVAQRLLVRDGEGWEQCGSFEEMEAGIPAGLAQTIEIELEGLSREEQSALEAGSLMGIAFPAWAVAAALEIDLGAAEERCEALARRLYFVERGGEDELPGGARSEFYVFAHEMFREALCRRQTSAKRAVRHLRIAQRLGEMFRGREESVAREMAVHYEAAGEWQQAAEALGRAARRAQQRQSHTHAAELVERALRLTANMGEGGAAEAMRRELMKVAARAESMPEKV